MFEVVRLDKTTGSLHQFFFCHAEDDLLTLFVTRETVCVPTECPVCPRNEKGKNSGTERDTIHWVPRTMF
jgi:hypothetical protein